MTDRPTPEAIIDRYYGLGRPVVEQLAAHGYRIVHPDDAINLCGGCRMPVKVVNERGGLSRCAYTCEGPGEHGWLRAYADAP